VKIVTKLSAIFRPTMSNRTSQSIENRLFQIAPYQARGFSTRGSSSLPNSAQFSRVALHLGERKKTERKKKRGRTKSKSSRLGICVLRSLSSDFHFNLQADSPESPNGIESHLRRVIDHAAQREEEIAVEERGKHWQFRDI